MPNGSQLLDALPFLRSPLGRMFAALLPVLAAAPAALAAANVSGPLIFQGADVACSTPSYLLNAVGDATTNDDGLGNDYVAVVFYDHALNVVDNDFTSLSTPGGPVVGDASYTLTFRVAARPLSVRVFDIGTPGVDENTAAGVAFAVSGSLLFEASVDPAVDAAACAALPRGPALHTLSAANPANQVLPSGPAQLVLNGVDNQLEVTVPAPAKLALFYTAECAMAAADDFTWLDLDLRVDGVAIAPTNDDDAFCTSEATGGLDRYVSARSAGVTTVGAGVHQISVRGQDVGTSSWWIGDSSLVVYVPEPAREWLLLPGIAVLAALGRVRRMRGGIAAGLALTLELLAAPGARAQGFISGTSETGAQSFSDALDHALDLGAGTSFAVNPTTGVRAAISVTAECSVAAAADGTWVTLDIYVDGVQISPTAGTFDAFCSSDGTGSPSLDNWVSAATSAVSDLAPGAHTIEVHASLQAGTGSFRIDDLSLTVIATELP